MTVRRSFSRFFGQALLDARLWAFFMFALACARGALILAFRGRMDPSLGAADFGAAMLRGAAYDAEAAAYWLLPSFLLAVLCGFFDLRRAAQATRRAMGTAFCVLTAVLSGVTIGYFREYEDQFNHYLFGLVTDDRAAIFQTIWRQYHPVTTFVCAGLVAALFVFALRRLLPAADEPARDDLGARWPLGVKIAVSALVLLLVFFSSRGSFERRPRQQKDMAVTRDVVLNRTVYSVYNALRYAYLDHRRLTDAAGLATILPDQNVRAAAALVSGKGDLPKTATLDDYLARKAKGAAAPPRHIFLLILESYDSWPLEERWRGLGVATCGASLAARGVSVPGFLPDSDGTIGSLAAIFTGLPDAGVSTNYQPSARNAFPTAPAAIFRRLGYRTRFFYAGFLSWQRVDDLAKAQGFDEVYGGPHMGAKVLGNEWGVMDADLFRFAAEKTEDDAPSFNVILTTSNHPPFNVDVYREGFPLRALPPEFAARFDGRLDLTTLGHFWYQDREVCRFVEKVAAKLPRFVVAMTGDHFSRRFPNGRPTLEEKSSVPLILYGPQALAGKSLPPRAAGSHIDIIPTLVEMTAPKDFAYAAVGHDIFDPAAPSIAIGRNRAATPDGIFEFAGTPRAETPDGGAWNIDQAERDRLERRERAQRAVAWWRIIRGPSFEKK